MVVFAGDMNGHVGGNNAGYDGTHGGFGHGSRNVVVVVVTKEYLGNSINLLHVIIKIFEHIYRKRNSCFGIFVLVGT